MFDIYRPADRDALSIQSEEQGYYWSACLDGFLRKHGLIAIRGMQPAEEPRGMPIVTRRASVHSRVLEGPCLVEGPLHETTLHALNVRAKARECESLELFDAGGDRIGRLCYPTFTARRIPSARNETSAPYAWTSQDPLWNNRVVRSHVFQPDETWLPVAYASFDGADERQPVCVSDGTRIVMGVPLFDIIGRAHAFPPLDAGYYAMVDFPDAFPLERWLVDLVLRACGPGRRVIRMASWPEGCNAALTVRHDYDRPIQDEALAELLAYYDAQGVRSTWFVLAKGSVPGHSDAIRSGRHEVALHSIAGTGQRLRSEIQDLTAATGMAPRGFSAHGGLGAAGYLGGAQHLWAEENGMLYGEMLGPGLVLPHPANRPSSPMPSAGPVVIPPSHRSLDKGTGPADHHLEFLLRKIPADIRMGGHVVVLNHPDIHVAQLRELLDSIDMTGVWRASLAEVANWCDIARFRARVSSGPGVDDVVFPAPLPGKAVLEMWRGGEPEDRVICEAEATAAKIPAAPERRE